MGCKQHKKEAYGLAEFPAGKRFKFRGVGGQDSQRGFHCRGREIFILISATVVRYLTKRFIYEYDPTLEFTYRHQTSIDDEVVTMEILDTAGQRPIKIWRKRYIVQIKNYLDEIKKARNVSLVIIGNKNDLDHIREVSLEEGEKCAQDLACAFFESSACSGDENIREAFHELYREVRRRKAIENGKGRRRSSIQQMKQVLNKTFTKINNRQ
ncbi:ras-related and estrogen-regulated growth inhibitor-like [Amphiura filiformis]|uniref:ras-related and estrogen-regulated growth inhibitor-like n=1 Tax=Amphiura filiformis TaxID=82378 RepID=UPI003B2114BC